MSVPQRQVWGRLVRLEANQGGGVTGPTGPIGPTGPTGIGLGGPTGPTGPIGPGSISGAAGTVLISDGAGNGVGDANLTWTSSTTTLLIGAINGASRPTITTAYGADGPLIIDFFSIDASGTVGGLGINMPDGNFNGLAVKFGPLPTPAANEYCIRPDAPSVVDLGAVGLEFRTLYTGTSVVTPQISGLAGGLTVFGDADVAQTNLSMTDGATAAERSISLTCSNGNFIVNADGSASVGGAGVGLSFVAPSHPLSPAVIFSGTAYPDSDNSYDLGVADNGFGSPLAWRTGRFGTSLATPLVVIPVTAPATEPIKLSEDPFAASLGYFADLAVVSQVGALHLYATNPTAPDFDADNFKMIEIHAESGAINFLHKVAGVPVDDGLYVISLPGIGNQFSVLDGAFGWNLLGFSGEISPQSDNTQDFGTDSARVRTGKFGTSVVAPLVLTTPTVVASLPAAGTAGAGAMACVTDALAPAYGAAVVGGGAVTVSVLSTGAVWNVS